MYDNTNSTIDNRPTILLLEEDDDTRPTLKMNLRKLGFRLLVAVDMEDAMDWMSIRYIPADLVLVDLIHRSTQEALAVGRLLRDRAKYDGHTPLVVMAEKFTKELEGMDDNVRGNDWISYPEDATQLHRLLLRLTPGNAA